MEGYPGELGLRPTSAGDGEARLELDATERHLNQAGTIHGGVLATIVDAAMGVAARSTTPDGATPATTQLTLAYLSPGHPGRLVVTARVRKRGDHLLLCEADVDQDGRSLVHAVATFALV